MSSAFHVHRRRITYSECTVGNHVYYSRYLDLLEEARGEWFRTLGFPMIELQSQGFAFPVVAVRIEYLAPARYDDVLSIELRINVLTRLRLNIGFAIRKDPDETLVTGRTDHICASIEERPRRMPVELFRALEPFVRAADPEAPGHVSERATSVQEP